MTQSSSGDSESKFTLLPSQSEIDVRATEFVKAHRNDTDEIGQSQNFWVDFFKIFGRTVRPDAQFERRMREDVAKEPHNSERMDLFWENILLVEQKKADVEIKFAVSDAFYYYNNIQEDKQPRYVLGCNFKEFHLFEIGGEDHHFTIDELPSNLGLFEFMRVGAPVSTIIETPVNRKAAEIMGKIYHKFNDNNYGEDDLQLLLVRLAYCYFADDTGLFGKKEAFVDWFSENTPATGKGAGELLIKIFGILDKPVSQRQTTQSEFNSFPYVNGKLFADKMDAPDFDSDSRQFLIDCGRNFNWNSISPAIFGNLFQGVMQSDVRHALGAHYTTKDNIMRVIWPLFLEKYWKEFEDLRNGPDKKIALLQFQGRLSKLEFLDPACGSGNFLIIAFEQLRELEIDLLKEVYGDTPESSRPPVNELSKIKVNQFHGIELHKFAARIAQTSLWMMDHLMHKKLAMEFGKVYANLPLADIHNIHQDDALEINDWNDVLESSKCSYVFGNPPFIGAKKMDNDSKEKKQTVAITKSSKLDYVSNWFVKAADYVGLDTPIGFVSTNSITQGEQVGELWPILQKAGLDIIFAYDQFRWESDAKGKAQVVVVVVGLSKNPRSGGKRIFSFDGKALIATNHDWISPYIAGCGKKPSIVQSASSPLNGLPKMTLGSQPIDGGGFILDKDKRDLLLSEYGSKIESRIRPFIGATEFIRGKSRWILTLQGISESELKSMKLVKKHVEKVSEWRLKQSRTATKELVKKNPLGYGYEFIPDSPFLVIPEVSVETNRYIPMGFMEPPTIPSNLVKVIPNASLGLFGLMTSKMHMAWVKKVCGRFGVNYRYSTGVVYNTFPTPKADLESLEKYAKMILDIRKQHSDKTLADLYGKFMPVDLRKAHDELDRAVDKLYGKTKFKSDSERTAFLLEKYDEMINDVNAQPDDKK